MASVVRIEFNHLPQIASNLESRAADVVGRTAFQIEARAKELAPVDTGNLMNSIQTEHNGLTATVSPGAEYGIYVEMGTYKMAAQPYMTPAAEAVRPAFHEAMRQLVEMSAP